MEPLLRRLLGRAMDGVVLMDRVSFDTGAVSRDDIFGGEVLRIGWLDQNRARESVASWGVEEEAAKVR